MPEESKYSGFKRYGPGERSELVPFIPESARTVLDIGCATGEFSLTKNAGLEICTLWHYGLFTLEVFY